MGGKAIVLSGLLFTFLAAPVMAASDRPNAAPTPYPVATWTGAYLASDLAQRANDASSSAHYLAQVLATDPTNPTLLRRTLQASLLAGAFDDAAAYAEQLVSGQSTLGLVERLILATAAIREGDAASARSIAGDISDAGLGAVVAPFVSAWTAVAEGDIDAAQAYLDLIRTRQGLTALASLHLALVHEQAGHTDAALQAYDAALDAFPSLSITQLAGNFRERQGDAEGALAIYRSFAAANPGSTLIGPDLARVESGALATEAPIADAAGGLSEAFYQLGRVFNQDTTLEPALAFTRLSLALRPDYPMAQYLLGDLQYERSRYDAAIAAYQSIPEDHGAHWSAMLQAADAMRDAERVTDAITLLRDLAAATPTQMEPMVRIGDLHRVQQDFGAAVVAYDEAFSRDPERAAADWTFLYRRGIALERSQNWPRAEADFIAAIEINPEHAHLLNYLGYSWVDRNENLQEGEELIRQALTFAPEDGYIIDSLGWVYYQTGRMEEAVVELERAVELLPDEAVINDHLGDAYWHVGRRMEARFQWQRALRDTDDPDLIAAIMAKLENGLVTSDVDATPLAENDGS